MKFYNLAICLALALTGCGGGGGGGSNGTSSIGTGTGTGATTASVETGVFVDGPVINIGYRTETQNGFTNQLGEYKYVPGETVTFFIGNLEFAPVTATGTVTPLDIAGATSVSDPKVVNIIRLLQTLDKDGDPDNGLEITNIAATSATLVNFGLSESDFELAVTALLDNAGLDTPVSGLVDRFEAIKHFEETISDLLGSQAFPSGIVITGNTIGDGRTTNSELRKPITFTASSLNFELLSRFSFSDAYAARLISTDLDTVYWMVFVTNNSEEAACLINFSVGVYRDSERQALSTELNTSFVSGSVRQFPEPNSFETNTCLRPGEQGLLSGIETNAPNLYTDLSEITFSDISASSFPTAPTKSVIAHTGTYLATPNAEFVQEISLPIRNAGAVDATLGASRYVLLDDDGLPLIFGFLNLDNSPDRVLTLSSGETQPITGASVFEGTANNMHVYVNYISVEPSIVAAAAIEETTDLSEALSADEYAAYLNDTRNQLEAYKASLVAE